MKGKKYGEVLAAEKYLPGVTIYQCGLDSFVMRGNPAPVDVELAGQGLNIARKALSSGEYNMVILDEINVAVDLGLIDREELLEHLKNKPQKLHVILTGRNAHPDLIVMADIVTEMRSLKHPYDAGVAAQKGIDF
jgi:cob(I)alamin adenosyltransferase